MKNIFVAIAVLLAGCGHGNGDFDASGRFEATEVIVSAEVPGRIMQLDLTEGDSLVAGHRMGFIDTVQLSLRVRQLQNSINGLKSRRVDVDKQLNVIKEQIATQKRERTRFETLVRADAANQKQLDDINSSIALLERQLAAQASTLTTGNSALEDDAEALNDQLAQVRDQLSRSYIASPVDGTVLAKYAEAGEMATAGRPLFKAGNVRDMFLRAYVTADQLTQVRLGDTVKVYADFGAEGQREYAGRIAWISDRSEFTPKTIQTRDERADLVYAMKVAVENDGYLKIGMYGQLNFEK